MPGHLEAFFECLACDDCSANIINGIALEDMYEVTHVSGVSKTVHLPERDLVFHRRGNFYVADVFDWTKRASASNQEARGGNELFIFINTTAGKESLYSAKEQGC